MHSDEATTDATIKARLPGAVLDTDKAHFVTHALAEFKRCIQATQFGLASGNWNGRIGGKGMGYLWVK